jgi:prepilin-type N-terminal cleavage/methylation domain-containing protein
MIHSKFPQSQAKDAGFTVLELMVATSVFAVVLLVLTAGVISFSRDYFKGIAQNNTQAVARAIIDDVAQNIQFGSGVTTLNTDPASGAEAYCIDSVSYSYALGKEVIASSGAGADHLPHGLVKASGGACGGLPGQALDLTKPALTQDEQELLGDHMRLAAFSVELQGDGTYAVRAKVAYGDSDGFVVGGVNVTASQAADSSWWGDNGGQVSCKSGAGSQFCAVSDLSTTVQARLGT